MGVLQDLEQGALLSVRDAAQRKGVSISTVYKAIREGRLSVVRIAGMKLLRDEDVAAWSPSPHGGARRPVGTRAAEPDPRQQLEAIMHAQGVRPIQDINQLLGDFWEFPENFDQIVRAWRDEPDRELP